MIFKTLNSLINNLKVSFNNMKVFIKEYSPFNFSDYIRSLFYSFCKLWSQKFNFLMNPTTVYTLTVPHNGSAISFTYFFKTFYCLCGTREAEEGEGKGKGNANDDIASWVLFLISQPNCLALTGSAGVRCINKMTWQPINVAPCQSLHPAAWVQLLLQLLLLRLLLPTEQRSGLALTVSSSSMPNGQFVVVIRRILCIFIVIIAPLSWLFPFAIFVPPTPL